MQLEIKNSCSRHSCNKIDTVVILDNTSITIDHFFSMNLTTLVLVCSHCVSSELPPPLSKKNDFPCFLKEWYIE